MIFLYTKMTTILYQSSSNKQVQIRQEVEIIIFCTSAILEALAIILNIIILLRNNQSIIGKNSHSENGEDVATRNKESFIVEELIK